GAARRGVQARRDGARPLRLVGRDRPGAHGLRDGARHGPARRRRRPRGGTGPAGEGVLMLGGGDVLTTAEVLLAVVLVLGLFLWLGWLRANRLDRLHRKVASTRAT